MFSISVTSVYSLLISVLVTLLTILPSVTTTSCTADWSCGTNEYCSYQQCLTAAGASVSSFYPYGKASGDTSLIGDDAKAVVSTSLSFPFAGTTYSYLFISSNGLISLGNDKAAPFSQLDPRAFPIENVTFIAPLWLDYDNRQALSNSANSIYYRVVSDEDTLASISDDVKENFDPSAGFSATSAVVATWFKVAKWKRFSDNLNTFQIVLATDGQQSYAILFYSHIGTTQVHGLYARAGFNSNSAGITSMAYELPNSGTSLVGSTLEQDSNVNVPGKWMFEISSTTVTTPPSTPVSEPVATPVSTPVSTPTSPPVKAPVATPISTPVSAPTKAPVATPVAAPVSPPVKAPVATPVPTPVSTPVATPVSVPVSAPVSVTTSRRTVGNPITTSAPFYSVLMDHPLTPPASLLGPIPKPYPTNSWHMNMWLNQGNMPIVTSPYIVEVRNTGVQVSYSPRTFTATSGITVFTENFAMLVKETIAQRQVLDWDMLSVTMIWSNNNLPTTYDANTINYGTRANSMIAPLVQGSPYITTKWDGLTPVITTVHAILSINGATGTTFSGTKFKMVLNNGQTWILYASNSITFTWSGSTLTATSTYTGVLRGVCMTDSSFETTLDQYKNGVPIASKVGWTATGDTAVLQFDYITEDDSAPLIMTLPHHRDMMTSATYVMQNAYVTMKGKMSGLVGKTWQMTEQLTTITWTAPRSIPTQYVESIRAALQSDQTMTQTASDTYTSGKNLAAMARLALIADEIGETTIATNIRNNLKTLLQKWFSGQTSDRIVYDHTWGGVTSSNGIKDSGADYGVGYYNDVHFHFGYFVYASAVVAKGDSAWGTTWAAAIDDLVRAYANPVHDSYFPVTRMKDWYAGHSWASGLFEFGDVKNQESSSESINGYYGMYLWGLVSNNANLRDLGRLMLAQEIRSTKKYWHMDNKSNEVYDQVFADNGCVGIVWGLKIDFATWFGANIEYIIGIQMMPYTPITEEYMTSTWVNTVYPTLSTALTRTSPTIQVGWQGFIYMAQAVLDKATAWTNINTLSGWDNGNSKTNALYWIATRA